MALLSFPDLLYENYIPDDPTKQDSILRKVSEYCGKPMYNITTDEEEPPYMWDFYHSLFFSYTVVSTIGKSLGKISYNHDEHVAPLSIEDNAANSLNLIKIKFSIFSFKNCYSFELNL